MPLSPEQLAQMDAALGGTGNEAMFSQMDAVLSSDVQKPKNFFQRVGEDVNKRAVMAGDIRQATDRGEQSKLEEAFQLMGKGGAGLVGDVAGEVVTSGLRGLSNITPDFIENPVKEKVGGALNAVAQSPVGQAVGGAVSSVTDAYGELAPRTRRNLESAGNLAMVVPSAVKGGQAVLDAGANTLKAAIPKPKMAKLSSEEIRAMGSQAFKEADQIGGVLKPQFMDEFITEIGKKTPQTTAGKILAGDSAVTKFLKRAQALRGKPLTLEAAKEVDEVLSDLAYSDIDSFGKFGKEGQKFLDMQKTFRKMIEDADQTKIINPQGFDKLKEARNYWSTSLRLRDVERIIDTAENMQTPSNSIKTGFRNLLKRGDKIKGYSPAEVEAIYKASKTGLVTDVLNVFGSRLGPIAGGIGGFTVGGPLGGAVTGAATYAGSTLARKGAEAIQKGKANKVADLIRLRVTGQAPKQSAELGKLGAAVAKVGVPIGIQDMTQEQILQQIQSMPPREAMELLKQIGAK